VPFTIQSGGKPCNYALAVNELGSEHVHRHVGYESSGESFDCVKLSADGRPHNPMINAGAIIVASLIRRDLSPSDRFDYILAQNRRMVGVCNGLMHHISKYQGRLSPLWKHYPLT